MIRETIINAEREESDKAHDLKLLNTLMKCMEEAIEEGNLFDNDEDDDESRLYGLILHSKLESTHVFRFRVAKNLIVFWLLYIYIYIYIYINTYINIYMYIYIYI